MTMMALMLAPAYKNFGEVRGGFGPRARGGGRGAAALPFVPPRARPPPLAPRLFSRPPLSSPLLPAAQWDGFGKKGSVIAAVLAVVIGTISYLLVSYFGRLNARKEAVSVAAKKAADLRYLAEGGASVNHAGSSQGHDNEAGGLKQSLLRA